MQQSTTGAAGPPGAVRGWLDALAVVLAGLVAMAAVAALGLWLAGADDLPEGGFPPVLAATLALAVGGSVQLDGGAGSFAAVDAGDAANRLAGRRGRDGRGVPAPTALPRGRRGR